MGMYWVLFDPIRESLSLKLSTEEAQFSIQRLRNKYINSFLIWKKGWSKWKKLNEFLRSSESPFKNTFNSLSEFTVGTSVKNKGLIMNHVPPEVSIKIQSTLNDITTSIIETKNLVDISSRQFSGDDLSEETITRTTNNLNLNFSSLRNSNALLKRNAEDKYKIELLLNHPQGSIFRSTAKDISLTGTYSERIVPHQFDNCVFDLIIINNLAKSDPGLKQIKINSRIIYNNGIPYIEYVNADANQLSLLKKVLIDYRETFQRLTSKNAA